MPISVVQPVEPAIERTRGVLFQPFDFRRWLLLGLAMFLIQLPEDLDAALNQIRNLIQQFYLFAGPRPAGRPTTMEEDLLTWIPANPWQFAVIATSTLLIYIAVKILVVWISSRGYFIFLDNVVRNQVAVREPWREYTRQANSLCWFRVAAGLLATLLIVLVLVGALGLAWPDIEARQFGAYAVAALVVAISASVVLALGLGLIHIFLYDFLVPVMYLRNLTILPAWREFRRSLLAGHVGTFVLYILFKILMGIVLGSIVSAIACGTLFLATLPYVRSVVFLPLFVFDRSYSLAFIEQFGPQWQIFQDDIEAVDELGPEDNYPYEIIDLEASR